MGEPPAKPLLPTYGSPRDVCPFALWLCAQPVDMRAGAERLLATVVSTIGLARANHGYLFANVRATRVKLLVHDGFGIWYASRRLPAGASSARRWSSRVQSSTL